MKKSILDYVIENKFWDSSDENCPDPETFKEFDEETGRWLFDYFSREEQAKIVEYGIFSDKCASDFGISRFVTRDWVRTEGEGWYPLYKTDWNYEADNAGKSESIFRWIDRRNRD